MSGKKNDDGKPDMALIPAAAALEEAHLWADGKKKYSAYNWYDGILYMRILSAMERHLTLLKAGIDFDYETKRHHGAALRCGSAMLIQFTLENRKELDDRMLMNDEVKKKIELMAQGESIFHILTENNIVEENDMHAWRKEPLCTEQDIEMMKKQASDALKLFKGLSVEKVSITSEPIVTKVVFEDESPYAKVARGIAKFNKEKT